MLITDSVLTYCSTYHSCTVSDKQNMKTTSIKWHTVDYMWLCLSFATDSLIAIVIHNLVQIALLFMAHSMCSNSYDLYYSEIFYNIQIFLQHLSNILKLFLFLLFFKLASFILYNFSNVI